MATDIGDRGWRILYRGRSPYERATRSALKHLEKAIRARLDAELRIQCRTRIIALGVITANIASLLHVIRSLMKGVNHHRELAKESWSVRYVPTICFTAFLHFFANPSFRSKLFCSTIYLDRLNFSLLDFNLRFCSK
ncbi:hypothetical protein BaOVIS_002300 [Babesia ovis]|uniref:Uncharacterized protein n=1 Tax=Babesia ovis TaxID=5869 RepID=A0A9W5WTI4_BABOV|nr:hypothetical protein BaOVIS_002300 [Babesia ovis]